MQIKEISDEKELLVFKVKFFIRAFCMCRIRNKIGFNSRLYTGVFFIKQSYFSLFLVYFGSIRRNI